jgi:hypothetical protein
MPVQVIAEQVPYLLARERLMQVQLCFELNDISFEDGEHRSGKDWIKVSHQ